MGRIGPVGPIKLGPQPGSGRTYSQRVGPDINLIFFKAHDQPTSFILGGLDGSRWQAGRAQG